MQSLFIVASEFKILWPSPKKDNGFTQRERYPVGANGIDYGESRKNQGEGKKLWLLNIHIRLSMEYFILIKIRCSFDGPAIESGSCSYVFVVKQSQNDNDDLVLYYTLLFFSVIWATNNNTHGDGDGFHWLSRFVNILTLIKGDCEIRISIKSRIDSFLYFDSMNCSGSAAEKVFRIGIK